MTTTDRQQLAGQQARAVRTALSLPVLLGVALALMAQQPAGAGDSSGETLILLHDSAPVVIHLAIDVDGKPHSEKWREGMQTLFTNFDKDGNGVLDSSESRGIPTREELASNNRQVFVAVNAQTPRPQKPELPEMNFDAFMKHLKAYAGPFSLTTTAAGQPSWGVAATQFQSANSSSTEALRLFFGRLDRDGDDRLVTEEFTPTSRLMKLDADEDGSISKNELAAVAGGAANQYVYLPQAQRSQPKPSALLWIGDDPRALQSYAARIIRKYGRTPSSAGELTWEGSGLSKHEFEAADHDGNGKLNRDELVAWMQNASPDVLVTASQAMPAPEKSPITIEVVASDETNDGGIEVRGTTLVIGKVQLRFTSQHTPPGMWSSSIQGMLSQQFNAFDRDNNGYLDDNESRFSPYRTNFAAADVDGDGKLFKEEFVEYMGRLSTLQSARTALAAADQGRHLFEILDQNRDGRVSALELQTGAAKAAAWDDNGDGSLSQDEIPNIWQLTIGRGTRTMGAVRMAPMVVNSTVPVPNIGGVPAWFTQMDRNRDGELARREFLGPLKDFQRFDTNGDGLLVRSEAAAARPGVE